MIDRLFCAVLSVAAVVVCGCAAAPPVRPYESLRDFDQAMRLADMVVEGEVVESKVIETYTEGAASTFGDLPTDCARKIRVSLKVTRPIRPEGDLPDSVEFYFFSPSYHADPAVLLDRSLPPVLVAGERLRVFLVERDGQYWLLAHERWYRKPTTGALVRRMPKTLPPVRYFDPTIGTVFSTDGAAATAAPGAPAPAPATSGTATAGTTGQQPAGATTGGTTTTSSQQPAAGSPPASQPATTTGTTRPPPRPRLEDRRVRDRPYP